MLNFFARLFDTSDFPARWYCGQWDEGLGWLHIISDVATWGAYTAIPIVLVYYVRKRQDFPFHRIFWLFAIFILACGTVHLVEATIFWYPVYRFSGLLKLVMATASWATVFALIKVTPTVLHLPSLVATNARLSSEIEQRQRSEAELRVLQARNEAILAGTRSIVWTCDNQFSFIHPQHSWERFTGQTWVDHQGRGWLNAVQEEDRNNLIAKWQSASERQRVFRDSGHLWHAQSASYHPFVIEAVPVVGADGTIQEWVGTVNDMHAQHEAEQALRNAEAEAIRHQSELELIYESAPVGMCLTDADMRYIRINEALAKINGIDRAAHYGKRMPDLLPDIATENWQHYEQVFRTGQALLNVEISGRTPAATNEQHWLLNFHPLKDEQGTVWAVSSIVQDITDRKQMELTLRESEKRANVANEAKSRFLANMSHEIRTPMAVILGYCEILKANLKDPDNLQCLSIIQRNGEHLLEIINDILDLSRIEAGKVELRTEPIRLRETLDELLNTMKIRAEQKQLKLVVRTIGKIPAVLHADATRLRQILINLVGNAIKFTNSGGEVAIECQLITDHTQRQWVTFNIIDSGIGIPEKVQDRLFTPFSQGDPSITRSFGGTGLGLAITKRSVEMLGGNISFVSRVGEGTTFTVQLPWSALEDDESLATNPLTSHDEPDEVARQADAHSAEQGCQQASAPPTSEVVSEPLACRVLVVDDRRDIRYLTQHFLESSGATVVTAENGSQAITKVRSSITEKQPFDVILMDMQMPQMDGKSAIKVLRADGVTVPIIALTADAMKGDREKYLEIGCNDYLAKPIDHQQLIRMVATHAQSLTQTDTPTAVLMGDQQSST